MRWIEKQIAINEALANETQAGYHQARIKDYNSKARQPKFKKGDIVKVWDGPYPATGSNKMRSNWLGPYEILEVLNKGNNYRVKSVDVPSKPEVVVNVTRISRDKTHCRSSAQSEESDDSESPPSDDDGESDLE